MNCAHVLAAVWRACHQFRRVRFELEGVKSHFATPVTFMLIHAHVTLPFMVVLIWFALQHITLSVLRLQRALQFAMAMKILSHVNSFVLIVLLFQNNATVRRAAVHQHTHVSDGFEIRESCQIQITFHIFADVIQATLQIYIVPIGNCI